MGCILKVGAHTLASAIYDYGFRGQAIPLEANMLIIWFTALYACFLPTTQPTPTITVGYSIEVVVQPPLENRSEKSETIEF